MRKRALRREKVKVAEKRRRRTLEWWGRELRMRVMIRSEIEEVVEKSRSGRVNQRKRQREERVADWAAVLMGSEERMWWRRASGRWLM